MELPELSYDRLVDFFDDANSLQYITENEEELKNTIYSSLKKSKKRYWIKAQINEGGVKKILEVRDESTGRTVAMAVLKKCENIHHIEEFLREARITAALQHPGIMPVHDIGLNAADEPFFTMKLVKGDADLATAINRIKSAKKVGSYNKLNERLELFLKICDAVAYAHSMGVVHLDLKPENIQLDKFGQVLVCDWGLAQFAETPSQNGFVNQEFITSLDFINITLNGLIKGSPGYMAPEQATTKKEQKDHRTDIFSLGAILYTLLTFRLPIRRRKDVTKMLEDTRNGKIVPLKEWSRVQQIPESLKKVTLRAMALKPEHRYQSVQELQNEIKSYLNGFATEVEDAGFFKLIKLFYQRHRVKFNLFISGVGLFSVMVLVMFWKLNESERIARSNEKAAVQNARRAKESEQKLYDSLLKLKYAEMRTKNLELIAVPGKYDKACKLFYGEKKFDAAYKLLKEIIEIDESFPRSWELLVVYAFSAQNFSDAIFYAEETLSFEMSPNVRQAIINIKKLAIKYKPQLSAETGRLQVKAFNALLDDCKVLPAVVTEVVAYRAAKSLFTTKPRIIPKNYKFQ